MLDPARGPEIPSPEPSCGTVVGGALLLAGLLLTVASLGTCAITPHDQLGNSYAPTTWGMWLGFGTVGGMLLCAAGAMVLAAAGRKPDHPEP